jgi:hypothetical protein
MLRLSVSVLNAVFFWNYSLFGSEKTFVDQFSYLVLAIGEAGLRLLEATLKLSGFFMVLYLISKGWRITRTGIPASDARATATAVTILLIALAFFAFYNGEYYFLTMLIMYFFVMPKVRGKRILLVSPSGFLWYYSPECPTRSSHPYLEPIAATKHRRCGL